MMIYDFGFWNAEVKRETRGRNPEKKSENGRQRTEKNEEQTREVRT